MAITAYEFLYWLNEIDEKHMRVKVVRAQNVKWACRKFMRTKPDSLIKIDMEVRHNTDDFIDISDEVGIKKYI